MLKYLFNKVADLMVRDFFKKKTLAQVFSCKSSEIFKRTYFVEHAQTHAWVKWTNKKCIHKIYSQENTADGVLFSAIANMWVYSFSKKGLHHRCISMKIRKFYRTSILRSNAARLLLISCDIFNVLLELSVLNQFSHS